VRQQCKGEQFLHFDGNILHYAIVDGYIKSTIHWKSIVAFPRQTVVTRTRHMLRCMYIAYVSCQYIDMGLWRQLVPRRVGVHNCSTQHETLIATPRLILHRFRGIRKNTILDTTNKTLPVCKIYESYARSNNWSVLDTPLLITCLSTLCSFLNMARSTLIVFFYL
jgi:hypothetical protein